MKMNRFERWIVKGIFAREVIQGPSHGPNIKGLYTMIREACENEFREDNEYTRDAYLREIFESTQFKPVVPADEAVTQPAPGAEVAPVKKPRKPRVPK